MRVFQESSAEAKQIEKRKPVEGVGAGHLLVSFEAVTVPQQRQADPYQKASSLISHRKGREREGAPVEGVGAGHLLFGFEVVGAAHQELIARRVLVTVHWRHMPAGAPQLQDRTDGLSSVLR